MGASHRRVFTVWPPWRTIKRRMTRLEEGRVAGAALDVFCQEPPKDSPLLKNEKVIVTPHLGASTLEAQANVAIDAAEQVIAVLKGRPVRYAVNAPLISAEILPILAPYLNVATAVGRMVAQLAEGQMSSIDIGYEGEIANYDMTALKAAAIGGLLEGISEERINVVNANIVAQRRGLRVTEHKDTACENYASLITVSVATSAGVTIAAGTVMRGELHIVRVNDYWINIVAKELPAEPDGEKLLKKVTGINGDDDGLPLKKNGIHSKALKGYTLKQYLTMLRKARTSVHKELRTWRDKDLIKTYRRRKFDISYEWTIYHVLEHFSGHYGQILLLKHLMQDAGVLKWPKTK